MTYDLELTELADRYLNLDVDDNMSIALLAKKLGCRTLELGDRDKTVWMYVKNAQPAPEYESIVTATLLRALHWIVRQPQPHADQGSLARSANNALAVMEGLLEQDRWRLCLQNSEIAYDWACLLIRLSVTVRMFPVSTPYSIQVGHAAIISTAQAIDVWFDASTPQSPLHSSDAVARRLFGDTWCDLAFHDPANQVWDLPHLIATVPPPALPGMPSLTNDLLQLPATL